MGEGERASRRRGSPGTLRAPSSRRIGREGVSHVQTFPARSPAASRSRGSPPPTRPPNPVRRALRSLWDPRGSRAEAAGPEGLGGDGTQPSRGGVGARTPAFTFSHPHPHCPASRGSPPGPLPEAGSRAGKYRTAKRVRGSVCMCVCMCVRARGLAESVGTQKRTPAAATRAAAATSGEESQPAGTLSTHETLLLSGRRAD